MILTLAIPVHNDLDFLLKLLARVNKLDCVAHVVVVDDGSDIAIDKTLLLDASGFGAEQVTLARHNSALGPGAARNHALELVKTDHVLFMDADDLPAPDLHHLVRDLHSREFDFCIFQHHDTRMDHRRRWSQMPEDRDHWRAAHVDVGALSLVSDTGAARLSRTANYPWNKIYRTAFLRDNGIGCSNILLHEDVELHWLGFLNANCILASDRIGVIHFVADHGSRLTNRQGSERLEVFKPLKKIARQIHTGDMDLYALPFFGFSLGLIHWISNSLAPQWQRDLTVRTRAFLRTYLPQEIRDELYRQEPEIVAHIEKRFLGS